MATYAVPEEKLTAIADEIRLKRDIVTELTLDDMPLQIALIGGGGDGWTKIFDYEKTYNIAIDTTFDSITPTTSAQNIMPAITGVKDDAGNEIRITGIDIANKTYIGYGMCMINLAFKSAPTSTNTIKKSIAQSITIPHIFSRDTVRLPICTCDGFGVGYNGSAKSYVYGILPAQANFGTTNQASKTGDFRLLTTALQARGHTTYFPIADVNLIDSANSYATFRWILYEANGITIDRQTVYDISRSFLSNN